MQEQIRPWYKEPWPFILIGITGLGVVAGSTLAWIGLSDPPEIVRGDYQQLGRGLTDTNVRTAQARALGLDGLLTIQDQEVIIVVQANQSESLPDQLLVQFQHPATSELDSTVLARRLEGREYRGQLTNRPHERAHIVVSDLAQSWWLAGRLDGQIEQPVSVTPRRL
jgi:uncharacterized protein